MSHWRRPRQTFLKSVRPDVIRSLRGVCRLSFNEDLTVRPDWLPPFMGDHRLCVLEWWHAVKDRGTPTCTEWKASRISWMKVRWCIPHLLRHMCLLGDTGGQAMEILLRENGTTIQGALDFLRSKLVAWSEMEKQLDNLHSVFKHFQCSIFCLGHFAHVQRFFGVQSVMRLFYRLHCLWRTPLRNP